MISLRSKITQAVLRHFFVNTTAQVYVNKLARELGLDPGNLDRKLKELENEKLLVSEFQGNQRYYYLNRECSLLPVYKELVTHEYGVESIRKGPDKEDTMVAKRDKEIIIECAKKYRARKIIVFGSSVTRSHAHARDIDLGVKGLPSKSFFAFYGELYRRLSKPVDLINLSKKTKFSRLVAEEGAVIYE